MGAIPTLGAAGRAAGADPGSMPRLDAIPPGCAFHPRCAHAFDRCRIERPEAHAGGASEAACWLVAEPAATPPRPPPRTRQARRHDGTAARRGARASPAYSMSPSPGSTALIEGEPQAYLKAVTGVSFSIGRRETLALVGESGSGKSTVARMMVGLLRADGRHGHIDGIDMWAPARDGERQKLRRRLQMIFQDPFASLNPRWRVERIIADPIRPSDSPRTSAEIEHRVGELLRLVGPRPGRRRQVSARVLRRPAPAHLHRPGPVVEPGVHRLRRADQRARRLGAGADPEPDARPAGPARPLLPLHQPQPGGGAAHGDAHRRHVPGPHRRDGAVGRAVRGARATPIRAC